MKKFKITDFFDEDLFFCCFVHLESAKKAIALVASERDRYQEIEEVYLALLVKTMLFRTE